MVRTFAILIPLMAAPIFGQASPSFDCSKAESSAEKLVCEDAELARLDRLGADRYAAALDAVRGLDSRASETEDQLRAAQRGWIKGRDECWKASDIKACVELAYLKREGGLARWMLKEPAGIAFWACDGNPANEVVTYYFDMELPSVRLERGDTVDTGSLVPTASGSKYEASFGRSIWIKGEEATYREPDPEETTYECILRQQD